MPGLPFSGAPGGPRVRRLGSAELAAYDVLGPDLAARVRLVRVPRVPGPFVAITLGRVVLLGTDVAADGTSPLLAHELVHVRQWNELGVPGFLARYLVAFGRGLWRHRSWMAAYRDIGLEREARMGAEAWIHRRAG